MISFKPILLAPSNEISTETFVPTFFESNSGNENATVFYSVSFNETCTTEDEFTVCFAVSLAKSFRFNAGGISA